MFSFHQNNQYSITEEQRQDMKLLQYDILYGKHYAYHGKDLYPASELQMGVLDVTAEQAKALTDGLHIYGSNYTKWSKVFVNGTKVPTSFISDKELVISLNDLADGLNNLVVNQMGSSDTIFRSSNVISYLKPVGEAPVSEDAATIDIAKQ